jgi:hypothetical protein
MNQHPFSLRRRGRGMRWNAMEKKQGIELDVSQWQRGMYYFRLVYGDAMVAGEKVIVE